MDTTEQLTEVEWQALLARADEVIPEDDFPSASDAGFREFLERNWHDAIGERGAALRALIEGAPLTEHQWFVRVVAESYYADPENGGNYAGASFRMIGFSYAPEVDVPYELPHYAAPDIASLDAHYEAIVVGSGAGGGVISRKLSVAGLKVLCIERGRYLQRAQVPMDHLRNHRFARYGHNVGPPINGNPRVIVSSTGNERIRSPHEAAYNNNAMGLGGGTRVWGAQAWRFAPTDFRLASTYGVPAGSSLADWPFDYEELAPHYDWAEHALGVAGEAGHRHAGARTRDYPMPPHLLGVSGQRLHEGAAALGWTMRAVPLAINSRDYDGRGPCARAGLCVGFSCPSGAKGGSHNTMLPVAMGTGRCTLACELPVLRVLRDGAQRVRGVQVRAPDGREREITADRVILSAGAIETARLLMLSDLGNHSDQLGRHLQGHLYTGARADFEENLANGAGPGPSIATCDFNHGNPGIVGGGMIANDYPVLPIQFWYGARHRASAPWGIENKQWMRHAYRRLLPVMGPTQEIPLATSRVRLDPRVRDDVGLPVARLSGQLHPETLRTGRFMRERAAQWLRACGGRNIELFGAETGDYVSGGQHQAGTCRMGRDPAYSVTDAFGRVHELDNLYVADASLHVSNGGFNPALTVMALAARVADAILANLPGSTTTTAG